MTGTPTALYKAAAAVIKRADELQPDNMVADMESVLMGLEDALSAQSPPNEPAQSLPTAPELAVLMKAFRHAWEGNKAGAASYIELAAEKIGGDQARYIRETLAVLKGEKEPVYVTTQEASPQPPHAEPRMAKQHTPDIVARTLGLRPYTAHAEPVAPNESGSTQCVVRWLIETQSGWLGAYDKEAFAAYLSMAHPSEAQSLPTALTGAQKEAVSDVLAQHLTCPVLPIVEAIEQALKASPQPPHAEPVAYVNGDELDNMIEPHNHCTIASQPDGWRKTPLYRAHPSEAREALAELVAAHDGWLNALKPDDESKQWHRLRTAWERARAALSKGAAK